ncbi:MAG: hypothetical protein KC443_03830 [Anaerolineales bacterium]|nr:hypothetical protein [Anaerolineales bacterium]MCB8967401.1 hypothetical protein [Ardenticatenaceae bacterium]
MIAETIIPWVLGTLLLLTLIMLISSVKAWRELKRSPYFFLRQQAEKRLQRYSSTSFVLLLMTMAFAAYAWRTPQDTIIRVALLTNAKPPEEEIVALLDRRNAEAESLVIEPEVVNVVDVLRLDSDASLATPQLPAEYDRFEPTADLNPDTALGEILFSTEITDNYEAKNPGRIFPQGFFTLYATFSYDAMADGMEWAWVWRHNGVVVDGGNELWEYGDNGPGYIFYGPEEGFQTGEYTLEVWVNGELLTFGSVIMNSAAALSGN